MKVSCNPRRKMGKAEGEGLKNPQMTNLKGSGN